LLKLLGTANFLRTIYLGVTLLLIAFGMQFVQMWSDDKLLRQAIADGLPLTPLHDFVYDNLILTSQKQFDEGVPDVPVTITIIGVLVFSVVANWWKGDDPLRKLRRSIVALSLLYFCRMISISVTQVPPVNPSYCRPFPQGWEILSIALQSLGASIRACSDMMYSGHTSVISTFTVRLWFDARLLPRYVRYLVRTLVMGIWIFAVSTFIAVRLHYSMDVWIGFLLGFSWPISIEMYCEVVVHLRDGLGTRILKWVECLPSTIRHKK